MAQKPAIIISEQTKKRLDKLKLIPEDTYENVIVRLLDKVK